MPGKLVWLVTNPAQWAMKILRSAVHAMDVPFVGPSKLSFEHHSQPLTNGGHCPANPREPPWL